MTWLGHIMRMQREQGEERLVKLAVRVQYDMDAKGDLFMDAPATKTFEEIEALAQDRAAWRRLVDAKFGPKPRRKRRQKRTKKKPTAIILNPLAQRTRLPPPVIKTTISAKRA